MITAKQIIRTIKLSETINKPLDGKIKELIYFLDTNLSNLKIIYTVNNYNHYGTNKKNILIQYDMQDKCCWVDYDKIWSVLEYRFDMKVKDIEEFMGWYISDRYRISIHDITSFGVWE